MEEWREIPGFYGWYEISSYGRVRSWYGWRGVKRLDVPRIRRTYVNRGTGYVQCSLKLSGVVTTIDVHRIVGEVFIPNPEGKPQVAHNNGNKTDNRVTNLRWVTQTENEADKLLHGVRRGRPPKVAQS